MPPNGLPWWHLRFHYRLAGTERDGVALFTGYRLPGCSVNRDTIPRLRPAAKWLVNSTYSSSSQLCFWGCSQSSLENRMIQETSCSNMSKYRGLKL